VIATEYTSEGYKRILSGRAGHVLSFLQNGINVLYSDVDTVWKKNPIEYLNAMNEGVDFVAQLDAKKAFGMSPYYCTGFFAIKAKETTIRMIQDWADKLAAKLQVSLPNAL